MVSVSSDAVARGRAVFTEGNRLLANFQQKQEVAVVARESRVGPPDTSCLAQDGMADHPCGDLDNRAFFVV